MNKVNYQKKLEETIENVKAQDKKPTLLLHACCGPCSSYVLEYLSNVFEITVLFYNPNIQSEEEYLKRAHELERLIDECGFSDDIKLKVIDYDDSEFYETVNGLEDCPEGGERCFKCYELRLREAAKVAKDGNFDYFTTTLSISPLKNADKLNEIGASLSDEFEVEYLFSDFKKNNGYQRSIELSKQFDLYRQNFCGCVYSLRDGR